MVEGQLVTVDSYGSGNVNDTYLAIFRTTFSEQKIVVQRINKNVFSKPETIMRNMRVLTDHVHHKLEDEKEEADRIWQLPMVIPSKSGRDFYMDEEGECWRAITRIGSATSHERITSTEHAFEAGTVLGQFHRLVADMAPGQLHVTLPGFHRTPQYMAKYESTAQKEGARQLFGKSMEAKRLSRFIEQRKGKCGVLDDALESRELTTRIIHGDPKMSNIMIDDVTGKGTSIVDLDTVMPSLIHFDFGDALRSACNPAGEETTSLRDVYFEEDLCESIVKGYMINGRRFLTEADIHYLYDSVWLLAFELGLRFFQDYLAGDVYFKTRYKEHNLNRARVQFRLCESIEQREKKIRGVIESNV
jgi:Ser/Thr protein kinase RdoA (MazF antagonist)